MNALVDWLGHGGRPVAHELAEQRAAVCETCPKNGHGKWWETAKIGVADVIRRCLETKSNMRLAVSNEEKLFMCSACGCCLRLKVYTPMEHIFQSMRFGDIEKLDPRCWILKEPQV